MTLWLLPSAVAVLATGSMLGFVWRRPPPPPLWPSLPIVLLAAFLFACGDLYASHLARTTTQVWIGCLVLYGGISLLGPGMLTVALRFAEAHRTPFAFGRTWWARAPWFLSAALYLILVTNPFHGLFLTPVVGARNEYGFFWYVLAGTNYAGTLTALALFGAVAWKSTAAIARTQSLLMMAASIVPFVASVTYVSLPFSLSADPTALALAATDGLMLLGVYRGQLFALTPVAFWELLRQDSDAALVLDASRRILYANPAAERLLTSLDLRHGESVVPELAAELRTRDGAPASQDGLLQPEKGAHGTSPSVFSYGHEPARWLSVEATTLRGRRGRLAGHCLRIRDETALHSANHAVAEQAAALSAVLAATEDAFLVTHIDGHALYANERYRALFDLPNDLAGAPDAAILNATTGQMEEAGNAFAELEEILRDPTRPRNGSFTLRDDRRIEWSYFPLMLDGRMTGRVWQLRDVTEQRRAAEHLRETQKAESLGVIAGGVAHDFNNLLAVIQGNATLARRAADPENERIARHLSDIESASERASELTEQLLAYTGRGAREIRRHDLSEIVAEVRSLLEVSISKRVVLDCALEYALPPIQADASQLRQVVMNLVLNAAEAVSGAGMVRLSTDTIELSHEDIEEMTFGRPAAGTFVRLQVEDTGCGMSEETASRIFEPFFTTKFAGRGLGLAATMGVIRSHGGALRVRTTLGEGSVFSVFLPAAPPETAAATGT